MRGSIVKKGEKFYIVVDLGKDLSGKRKQKWVSGFKSQKEAELELPKILLKIQEENSFDYEKVTISEFLERWIKHMESRVRPSTLATYKWAQKHIKNSIGAAKLSKLKPIIFQDYYEEKLKEGLSPTSVKYQHAMLFQALRQAVKWQYISKNCLENVDPPRVPKFQSTIYNQEQIKKLIEFIKDSKFYLPILMAVSCGLRRGEVCALRWQDVNFDLQRIHVKNSIDWLDGKLTLSRVKTRTSERAVSLPGLTMVALKIHKESQEAEKEKAGKGYNDQDYVWAWPDGRPHDPDYFYKFFIKLCKKAELPKIRLHDLRHSHATFLLMAGVPVKVVSERLGHSSTAFTQDIYSHVLQPMQDAAAKKVDDFLNG